AAAPAGGEGCLVPAGARAGTLRPGGAAPPRVAALGGRDRVAGRLLGAQRVPARVQALARPVAAGVPREPARPLGPLGLRRRRAVRRCATKHARLAVPAA